MNYPDENAAADWLSTARPQEMFTYAISPPNGRHADRRKVLDFAMAMWECGLVELVTRRIAKDHFEMIMIRRRDQHLPRTLFSQHSTMAEIQAENERHRAKHQRRRNKEKIDGGNSP